MPELLEIVSGPINQSGDVMAWGIIMALFTVIGMLVLVLAEPRTKAYQTFGREVLNPPATEEVHADKGAEVRRAA
jgi:hypothetical protein